MDLQIISIIAGFTALALSLVGLLVAIYALVLAISQSKATHSVHMVPVDEEIERANEEFVKQWSTSEDAITKQNKLYKEDIEENMPEFALDDEDKEVYSI